MNLHPVIGAIGIIVIAIIFFALGYLQGRDGRKHVIWKIEDEAYDRGYSEGYESGKEVGAVLNNADPLRERRVDANRRAMPRPDSAGPIKVHRAAVRGDHRLPQNQDEKGNRRDLGIKPPRTKLIPPATSAGDDAEKLAIERLAALGTDRAAGLAMEIERGRQRREEDFND